MKTRVNSCAITQKRRTLQANASNTIVGKPILALAFRRVEPLESTSMRICIKKIGSAQMVEIGIGKKRFSLSTPFSLYELFRVEPQNIWEEPHPV